MPRTAAPPRIPTPTLRSPVMRDLDRVVRLVAPKEVGVSLVGESGSGKEVLARRIHDLSSRRAKPFIPINCAAVPEALFESELFGHEKGAFTGATERVKGKIEAADRGTLFLDEIGEMPIAVQAKLLRFLENGRFMRVGGTEKIAVDARLVSATLKPLEEEVRAGRFRGDLFYRIQGITLRVPALRERPADVPHLVREFLAELAEKHRSPPIRLGRSALAALVAYEWPGNVRELRNVLERLTVLRAGKSVRVDDLPEAVRVHAREPAPASNGPSSIVVSLDDPLDASIARILDAAIDLEGGNRSRAARRLGVSLRTVQRHALASVGRRGSPSERIDD